MIRVLQKEKVHHQYFYQNIFVIFARKVLLLPELTNGVRSIDSINTRYNRAELGILKTRLILL